MRSWTPGRNLLRGALFLFVVPTAAVGAALALLSRGVPSGFVVAVAGGLLALAVYLGAVVYILGRSVARALKELRLGTELMATVNPGHRLPVAVDTELGSLADEINRMADSLTEARSGLEREVARATRELMLERGKLSAVLEALGEGVAVATPDGRITLANRVAHDLLGAGSGGLLGRSLFDFVDRQKVAHFLGRLGRTEEAAERFTLHPANDLMLETVMTPFFDEERGMLGFVLVLHDVTAPARSDEEHRRVLHETVLDLRGPLASIRSLSESLLGDPAFAGAPAGRLLHAIHAEAVRLSGLVREMGAPARLGLAQPPWHFETISVSDLVTMALRRLREEGAGPARVELDGDASSLPPLRAEVSAFSGALTHLLRAAAAVGKPGGRVWVTPRGRGRVLQVDIGAEATTSATELEALLDVPRPLGAARRATVRDIIRQHAGEVWAYEAGGRAGFRITVPVVEAGEPALAAGETEWAGTRFVGAGTVSGAAEPGGLSERPDLYDFSLFEEMECHVPPADRESALEELGYVVFDLETTGLHPEAGDRVVSIAGVRVRGGAVKRGQSFDALVNPRRPIPAASARFHGITDAMVAEAPPIDVVLPAFLRFAEGAVLVGHQVWFDIRFLGIEAGRLGLPPITLAHPILDTAILSDLIHGSLPEHGLDAVARRLGVAVRGRHSALGDALATAEVFVRLLPLLKRRRIVTLGHVLDAAREFRGLSSEDITPGATS